MLFEVDTFLGMKKGHIKWHANVSFHFKKDFIDFCFLLTSWSCYGWQHVMTLVIQKITFFYFVKNCKRFCKAELLLLDIIFLLVIINIQNSLCFLVYIILVEHDIDAVFSCFSHQLVSYSGAGMLMSKLTYSLAESSELNSCTSTSNTLSSTSSTPIKSWFWTFPQFLKHFLFYYHIWYLFSYFLCRIATTQPAITSSKLTIETLQ